MKKNHSQKKCDILIVTYNSEEDITNCLQSIIRYSQAHIGKIVIIDNASTDQTAVIISNFIQPNVTINAILNKTNLGFSKANNIGLALVDSELVLFLNPDTILINDLIGEVIDIFAENQSIGVVGPGLITPNGILQYGFGKTPTVFTIIFEFLKSGWYNKLMFYLKLPYRIKEVDWVSGGCLFSKSTIIKRIGGFDEKMFMYAEDVDLCLRIKKEGYFIKYASNLQIVHIGGKSQIQNREQALISNFQSRLYFINKYYNGHKSTFLWFFFLIFTSLRFLIFYFLKLFREGYAGYALAYKSAFIYLVHTLPNTRKK